MLKINEENYSHFTASERVNLTIAAFSRNDQEEIGRLTRSCPRRRYSMLDHDYTRPLNALCSIIELFSIICNFYHHQITLCKSFISTYCIFDDDKNPIYATETREQKIQKLYDAQLQHVAHLKAVYNALEEFCMEVGLNYDHIIEWLNISPETTWRFINDEHLILTVEPDQEFTDYVKTEFLNTWEGETH